MNIYVSDEIRRKWINFDFIGKPFKLKDGRNYIRVYSHCFDKTFIYNYENDFIWFEKNDIIPLPHFNKK